MITWPLSVNCITSNIEMGICISYSAAWGASASLMAAHARHFECVQLSPAPACFHNFPPTWAWRLLLPGPVGHREAGDDLRNC